MSPNVVTVDPTQAAAEAAAPAVLQAAFAYPRAIALPSGRTLTQTRPIKGRDVVTANRLVEKGDGEVALSLAMVAQTLAPEDGIQIVYEDLLDLEFDDALELIGETVGKSRPSSSPKA